ncbi:MAG: acyl carrier protein [Arenicella sp.]|jgi:acyl carrier protein
MDNTLVEFNEIIKECIGSNFSEDHYLIESWTSMQSLIIVSAIDEHYDVLITHEELKSCRSTVELLHLVNGRKN